MKRKKQSAAARAKQAVERALTAIQAMGWTVTGINGRYVAKKRIHEREDESTTTLFESDYTIEGLAATVARREREEGRKSA